MSPFTLPTLIQLHLLHWQNCRTWKATPERQVETCIGWASFDSRSRYLFWEICLWKSFSICAADQTLTVGSRRSALITSWLLWGRPSVGRYQFRFEDLWTLGRRLLPADKDSTLLGIEIMQPALEQTWRRLTPQYHTRTFLRAPPRPAGAMPKYCGYTQHTSFQPALH